jgi:hypothetical protein
MWWGCVVSAARLMVFDRRRDFGGSSGDAAFGGLRCEDLCKHGRQLFVIHIHFRQGEYYVFDGIGCSKQGTVGNTVMYVLKKSLTTPSKVTANSRVSQETIAESPFPNALINH